MFRRQQMGVKQNNQSYRRQPKGRDIPEMHENKWERIGSDYLQSHHSHNEKVKKQPNTHHLPRKPLSNLVYVLLRIGGVISFMNSSLVTLSAAGSAPPKLCNQQHNNFFKPAVVPMLCDERQFGATSTLTSSL